MRYLLIFLPVLLIGGCATDPWKDDAPDFEVLNFICPVPAEKFIEDDNCVMAWSVLGPIDPGNAPSIHTEYIRDEALLTGNRTAPRGSRWQRTAARNTDDTVPAGQVDLSAKFKTHPKAGGRRVFYACATLKCDSEYPGMTLHAASGGKLKIWLNGNAVYSCEHGAADLKTGAARIDGLLLNRGCNRIVVKFLDDEKDYQDRRKFSLRFTDRAGNLSMVR
ncbi:MAG: hypothetical protein IJS14_07090 [Lentisphaeria bacterium]|nr:hypothetical protein [Lentisphaeria bacterium]